MRTVSVLRKHQKTAHLCLDECIEANKKLWTEAGAFGGGSFVLDSLFVMINKSTLLRLATVSTQNIQRVKNTLMCKVSQMYLWYLKEDLSNHLLDY